VETVEIVGFVQQNCEAGLRGKTYTATSTRSCDCHRVVYVLQIILARSWKIYKILPNF